MPIIMSSMIFQTSRRRLLAHLIKVSIQAEEERRNKQKDDHSYENDEEKMYIDGLNKTIDAAEKEVRRLEYWSDVKKVEREGYAGVNNTADAEEPTEWEASAGCMGHQQEVLVTPSGETLVTGT